MPECQNCGGFVSQQFNRVFSPNEDQGPRCCPNCPDKVRDGRDVREALTTRNNPNEPSRYDPDYAEGDD